MKKYIITSTLIIAILSLSATFSVKPVPNHEFQNLKVLPKDISGEQLGFIMDSFKSSLGVKCSYCHPLSADSSQGRHLDFVSDAKPQKLRAREMMLMTAEINKTFFNPNHSDRTDTLNTVMCYTCHRGISKPDHSALFPELDSLMNMQRH
ncbi:MAG: c-type cytochrome [Bacteroidetes bacterium]|nr:c-type cytochrome [Bacteroidota bacterium]MBK8585378.1 c-type cytochrome [Bacteroidota bacterium]MBP9791044.1 c-type cytochrome [Bacteroidia bacterium]